MEEKSIVTLAFKVVEPMMFRGSGEFIPEARGPQSAARSQVAPSPSTFSGTLATALIDAGIAASPKPDEWHRETGSVLRSAGIRSVRGPYIIAKTGGREDVLVQHFDSLVPINELYEKSELLKDGWNGENGGLTLVTPKFTSKVGIGLSHSEKAAKEGLIYTATMVDYSVLRKTIQEGGGVLRVEEVHPEEVLIAADLELENKEATENIGKLSNRLTKMGGEGRAVVVKIRRERGELTRKVTEEVGRTPDDWRGEAAVYIATQLITESPPADPEKWRHVEGGYVYPQPPQVSPETSLKWIKVKAEPLGAGYRARKATRKPAYSTILPGSTLLLTNATKNQLRNTFKEPQKLIPKAIATEIGYATIIPIPILKR
ncbi:MAG: type III-B CRISPR module-associated Cmr3 family protein [Candidatus Jordarchaeales archaeon]